MRNASKNELTGLTKKSRRNYKEIFYGNSIAGALSALVDED